MYEAFFGLRKRPFSATPDATCFFAPEPIQEIHDELLHRIENGQGISILTGEAGTGKTLLLRKFAKELQPRFATVFLGTANFPTRRAFLQAVLYELGQRYSGLEEQEFRLELLSHLKQLAFSGRSAVLLIDEAHLLSERLLEEIRAIADLSEAGQPLARVILSGPLQLEENLTAPALQAFNERITCHVPLEPLTQQESVAYVEYRLRWAGGASAAPFTPDALTAIAQACNGLPRCLNQLCDHSLLLAFVAESRTVTRDIVLEALTDLKQLPLHWNHPLPADAALGHAPEHNFEQCPLESNGDEVSAPHAEQAPASHAVELHAVDDDAQSVCFEVGAPSPRESIPVEDRSMINAWNPDGDDAGQHHSLPFERSPFHSSCEHSSCEHSSFEHASFEHSDVQPAEQLSIAGEFEEEIVIDRYAQLDAGLDAGPGSVYEAPQPGVPRDEIESDDPVSNEIVAPAIRPVLATRTSRPVEIIDEIIPLVQAALDPSPEESAHELQEFSALGQFGAHGQFGAQDQFGETGAIEAATGGSSTESEGLDVTSLDVPTDEASPISEWTPEEATLIETVHAIERDLAPAFETTLDESTAIAAPGTEAVSAAIESVETVEEDTVAEESAEEPLGVEEQLGAGVFDVCLEVQEEILGRLAPLAPERGNSGFDHSAFEPPRSFSSEPAPSFSPEPVTSEPIVYDVIEPESSLEHPQTAIEVQELVETVDVHEEPRRPNYKHVFSLLRRRQGSR